MNKTKIAFGAGILCLATFFLTANALAFELPWSKSTEQERYNMAEEQYAHALQGVKLARQQLLQAQGDLAWEKSQKASQEHNMEELQRLTDVVNRVKQEKEEIETGRLVFRWERFMQK